MTLGGVWITQFFQNKRTYKSSLIKQRFESLLELQAAIYSIIDNLDKFSFIKFNNQLLLGMLKGGNGFGDSIVKDETVEALLNEFKTNIENLSANKERLYKAYYIVNIYLTNKEEEILDYTIQRLLVLSESVIVKSKNVLYMNREKNYIFVDQLREKMEEVTKLDCKVPESYDIIKSKLFSIDKIK